jgi:hypothetical protein
MRTAVKNHIGKKFGLVNLTIFRAGDSDTRRDFIFYKIRQIVIRAVSGSGFLGEISLLVRPQDAPVYQKEVDKMSF